MKRMLITAVSVVAATAAFAAPAGAADLSSDIQVAPCYSWETYAECLERIARETDPYDIIFDDAIPLAFDTVGDVITEAEGALARARAICEQISEECDTALL